MKLSGMLTVRAALGATIPATALLSAAPMYGCVMPASLETKSLALEIEHQSGSGIDVETDNGSVTVTADPSTDRVTVSAEVRARTVERLEATQIVAERTADGTLTLRVQWADGKRESNEGATFDVTLPDAHGVKLDAGNGALHIVGLSGDATLTTSNGRITVEGHDGPVNGTTSNGRIEVVDVTGPAHLRTSNGKVRATGALGLVDVHTSNGAVEVELADDAQGPCSVETSNGAVTFLAGASMKASLDLSTSNGKIVVNRAGESMEFKNSARIELNGGGPTCTLSTSNGRITVVVGKSGDDDEDDTN